MAPALNPSPYQAKSQTKNITWLAVILLTALVCLAYFNSLNVPLVLDDIPAIEKNTTIRNLWSLLDVLNPPAYTGPSGRPLLNLSFAVNYALSGTRVLSYHLVNLSIHLFAALTLFGIIRRTLENTLRDKNISLSSAILALAATSLWAIHPIQTEAVTYISQRAEILMGLFYLLTLYSFIRALDAKVSKYWYIISVLFCFLGMACKQVMVTAPAVILLYDWIFISKSISESICKRTAYYIGLSMSWLFLAALMIQLSHQSIGFNQKVSIWEYAITECRAIVHYFQLALIPTPLVFDYGPIYVSELGLIIPYALTLIIILSISTYLIVKKPSLGFLFAWVFIIFSPTSSFVPVALQPIAESRMYLPIAALCVLLVLGVEKIFKKFSLWIIVAIGLLALYMTIERNLVYADPVTLWKDTLAKSPHNPRAHADLGEVLAEKGETENAILEFKEAIRLSKSLTIVHYDLARALHDIGKPDEAIAEYKEALRLNPKLSEAKIGLATTLAEQGNTDRAKTLLNDLVSTETKDPQIYYNLGLVLLKNGETEQAIIQFNKALALNPTDSVIRNALGTAQFENGKIAEAIATYKTAIKDNPSNPVSYHNLGNVYFALEQINDSEIQNKKAIELKPDYGDAHTSLGLIAMTKGDIPTASKEFEEALRHNIKDAEAHFRLGNIHAMQGNLVSAIEEWKTTIALHPNDPEAHNNLGQGLADTGHKDEALEQFKLALQLRPDYPQAKANLEKLLNQ